MFQRLGETCHRHPLRVILAWLAALVVGGVAVGAVGSGFRSEFSLPNVESRRGFEIIEDHFGGIGVGPTGTIVFRAAQGVDDPEVRAAMEELFSYVATLPGVQRVTSPYSPEGAFQINPDRTVAFAGVEVDPDASIEETTAIAEAIKERIPRIEGLQVELGGQRFAGFEQPNSELIGLAFAVVILIVAFGSVMAMGLPVGVALAGIGVGTTITTLLSNVMVMPDFSTTLGVMLGLGVGIDYALFIVTRYREQLHAGHPSETSAGIALNTAGRAVAFAGTTVVISLMGMLVMNVSFVRGLATGASVVVAVTMLASLTLLPAILGLVRERVEVTRWRGLIAAGCVAVALLGAGLELSPLLVGMPLAVVVLVASLFVRPLRATVPRRPPKPQRETFAYRWSRVVQRHPVAGAVVGAGLLVGLALPVLGMRLGFSDEGNFPPDTTTRRAYDLLAEGFGPGFNGPFVVVAALEPGTGVASLAPVRDLIAADPGVVFVSPVIPSPDGAAALMQVIPTTAPQDAETAELVHRLRSALEAAEPPGTDVVVTGEVAVMTDFTAYLSARLPWFFTFVLGLSFLLLMAVFRSLLVPLKAVVVNLVSIGAAYGVVVAVFQWGWGGDLLGIAPAPIEPFIPMMMFAIVFGLSMDYEVFLLSRVREEWLRTGDPTTSVADGLAATARVITAAAAIMVVVFGSFLGESDRIIKLMGTGLATAVLLDATIVRMLLVPATMELLGARNWWLPTWLDRILPRLDVEGTAGRATTAPEGPAGAPVVAGVAAPAGAGNGDRPRRRGQPLRAQDPSSSPAAR